MTRAKFVFVLVLALVWPQQAPACHKARHKCNTPPALPPASGLSPSATLLPNASLVPH